MEVQECLKYLLQNLPLPSKKIPYVFYSLYCTILQTEELPAGCSFQYLRQAQTMIKQKETEHRPAWRVTVNPTNRGWGKGKQATLIYEFIPIV